MSIHLTESAAAHIRQTLSKRVGGVGLRFGVRTDGCSGYSYIIDVADSITVDDTVFEEHGVKVVVDKKSLPIVNDTTIDFVKSGLNTAFKFDNPHAEHYCGCGESFNLKSETQNSGEQ